MYTLNRQFQAGRVQFVAMLVLIVLALAAGFFFSVQLNDSVEPPQTRASTFLRPAKPLPDFTLTEGNGGPFITENFTGKWSVVFFGYTQCPDICPTTLNLMRLVAREVPADQVNYVFISVDPERDEPAQLKTFTAYFNPDFIGATADIESMQPLLKALGVVFMKSPGQTADDYLIDHSAALYVINPQAQLAAVITPPHDVDNIVHDLKLFIEK